MLVDLATLERLAADRLDGGGMDCGSGLLLLLSRRMRSLEPVSYTHLDVYKRQVRGSESARTVGVITR